MNQKHHLNENVFSRFPKVQEQNLKSTVVKIVLILILNLMVVLTNPPINQQSLRNKFQLVNQDQRKGKSLQGGNNSQIDHHVSKECQSHNNLSHLSSKNLCKNRKGGRILRKVI